MICNECGEIMETETVQTICRFCDGTFTSRYGGVCTCNKGMEEITAFICNDCGIEEWDFAGGYK